MCALICDVTVQQFYEYFCYMNGRTQFAKAYHKDNYLILK
jgi:hypothetical protein